MRRKQGIATLVAGTMVVFILLAVFAVAISDNQSQARHRLEYQARQRAVLVSGLLAAIFQQTAHLSSAEATMLGTPTVADATLQRLKATNAYSVLIGSGGRIIAHSSGFDAPARNEVLDSAAVKLVEQGKVWGLGNNAVYRGHGVTDFAIPVMTSQGKRILVNGLTSSTLAPFLAAELSKVPGVERQHQLMIDGNGVVIGSTVPDRPAGYVIPAALVSKTLDRTSGITHSAQNGVRYYDNVPLQNSTWKLALTVPAGEFFASVSGFHHWLAWLILAAFGVVAIVALALVYRSLKSAERIRRANAMLNETNGDLATAHMNLEESNSALALSNEALERQAQELVRSNAELDQFASIASHDLQEPLRKVRTFTERISDTEAANLSEQGMDYLRRANASAERMQTLIEDLLRLSRVTSQARPFGPVDLAALTTDVLEDLSEQVASADARIEVSGLPTISADAPQMRQLLQNLISNALKFRRDDAPLVVQVKGEVQGGWLTLTVADNGIGFDPQYAQRIFRVFERLHGRGSYPGTGIGLALCRKIAERHGGTAVATAVPGEGATFTVTMQTERAEAVDGLTRPAASAASDSDETIMPVHREDPFVAA